MYQLPGKYRTRHRYIIAVYDQILGLFTQIEKDGFLKVQINIQNIDEQRSIIGLNGEELFNWMIKHNYTCEIAEMQFKECFAAILSDMLQYLLTALKCSSKGQLSVTYALLRKPLKDGLFYLEQLLVNPDDFLLKFNDLNNVNTLAVDKRQPEEIENTIKRSIDILGTTFYDSKEFYDLRYNKKNIYGFEPLFELANHLITKHEYYRTSEGNFNFIFSDNEAKESQWEFLYLHMPNVIYYIFSLVSSISSEIITLPKYWPLLRIKYLLGLVNINTKNIAFVIETFRDVFKEVDGKCDFCNEPFVFNLMQFTIFERKFSLKCMKCGKTYNLAEDAQQWLQPDSDIVT